MGVSRGVCTLHVSTASRSPVSPILVAAHPVSVPAIAPSYDPDRARDLAAARPTSGLHTASRRRRNEEE
eukprot:2692144-Rhodomonas_salina.1